MELNIAVCVKSVPDPELYSNVSIDPVTKLLVRQGVPSVINPVDRNAIELAMKLKEKCGGKVTLFSMGVKDVQKQLREGLAYGADGAVLVSDRKFAGADSLATSYTLALAIRKCGNFDLIILGNESADGATTHVPSQLGEWLELPHMTDVVSFSAEADKKAVIRKRVDGRYLDYEITLPAVIGITKEINKVRTPNMKGILSAKNKPIRIITADDIPEADESLLGLKGSPTQNGELHEASFGRQATELKGSPQEIAQEICRIIKPFAAAR